MATIKELEAALKKAAAENEGLKKQLEQVKTPAASVAGISTKEEKELVALKMKAGLSEKQAVEVVKAQVAQDKEAAKAAKSQKKD